MRQPVNLPKRTSERRPRRGVTLVETFTCTVAIAVLSGVMLLALGRGCGSSRKATCLSNLHQIARASARYSAEDPGRNTIPVHPAFTGTSEVVVGDYQFGGKSGNVDDPAFDLYSAKAGFGALTRPLNRYLYELEERFPPECRHAAEPSPECAKIDMDLDMALFRCPSDQGSTGNHLSHWRATGRSSFDYFGTSYVANASVSCNDDDGRMYSVTPFLRPVGDVPNPARTIQYMENCGRFAWTWGYGPWELGTDFIVRGWHGVDWKFNMAFVDGHVATIEMKGSGKTGVVNSVDDVEYIGGLPGGMDEWWRIVTRGKDWQFDCLPAQQIDTGKRCAGMPSSAPAGDESAGTDRSTEDD